MSLSVFARSARTAARATAASPRVGMTRLSSTSSMHDNNPEILETEKQKNLSGRQQKGSAPHDEAPGWNEYLASASEAAVKADKSTLEAPDEMAKRSVEHIRNRHHHDDGTHVTIEADYEKDEVEGPLRKSGKKT